MDERGRLTADYEFALPPHLVAQTALPDRSSSRLLIVDRASETISHARFADIVELIPAGDALVLNTTRVLRARLLGTRDSGARAEVFILRPTGEPATFEAMVHPGGKVRPGRVVHVAPELRIEVLEITDRRTRIVRLHTPLDPYAAIERFGHVPLPPYIARADAPADTERYQTVYAREPGSVAAPTAGLHFTPEILGALEQRGVRRVDVLLHVGAGTFKPVEADDPAAHVMHEEWYSISAPAAETLRETRARGAAIWAVGTTVVRTLESASAGMGTVTPGTGYTRLFIRPPAGIHAVDHLVTNFHLPRSTLIMLVASFAGYDLTMRAYRTAIDAGYRFYSYGDAMVIL